MDPQKQWIRSRDTVDRFVENHALPCQAREVGQIRVVLDGIPAEVWRQVRALSLQELRQTIERGARCDEQDVRQIVAGNDRGQLRRLIVGQRGDVELQGDAQL